MSDSATKAVFLSYASQDAEAAKNLCDALRAAGVEVWFDQRELVGGDQWDAKIRGQIAACELFVPIISAHTEARLEGYFRIEWKLAAQRTLGMAEEKAFLLPVVVDDTRDAEAHVPVEFRAVQWTRLSEPAAVAQFVGHVKHVFATPTAPPWRTAMAAPAAAGRRSGPPGWVWGLVAAGVAAAFFLGRRLEPATAPPKAASEVKLAPAVPLLSENSLAVLPFANMSEEAGGAYFADAMHEQVIVSLAKIRDLKVISRTSVMSYKVGARNLRAIAGDLGVAHILEGSVQRAAGKVRITATLVDARNDHPIWAETYDHDLIDAFAIQSLLAREITGALRAKLTASERLLIARRPTENQEAYELYMRGRTLAQDLGFASSKEPSSQVVTLYEQAIAKDPKFATAHVQLSLTHSLLYRFSNLDPTPERLARAQSALNQALRLAPDLPEAKLARGVITYLGSSDWAGALRDFRAAEADLPNDDQLQWWLGNALRRLGQWDEAIQYFLASSALNPRAPAGGITAIQTLRYLRRFAQARDVAERYLARFPNNRGLLVDFARVQFELDGDRAAYLRRMETLPPEADEVTRLAGEFDTAVRNRKWAAADQILGNGRLRGISETPGYIDAPIPLYRAIVALLDGRPADAKRFANEALLQYGAGAWNRRQQPWALMGQARAEAILGRAEEAVVHAKAAWATVSAGDALDSVAMQPKLADVYLFLGRKEEALAVLRAVMNGPTERGPQAMRWEPLWAPLAEDPSFQEILRLARSL